METRFSEKEIRIAKKKLKGHLKAHDFQSTLHICEDLISGGVLSADLYTYQGVCQFQLDQNQQALGSYESALQLDANYHDALKGLAQCLLNNPDLVPHQKKLATFTRLLELFPDIRNCEVYKNEMALLHWKLANYQECFKCLETLLPAENVLPVLFADVAKTHNTVCFEYLQSMLNIPEISVDLLVAAKFYYEYASHLNNIGENPSPIVDRLVDGLGLRRDGSGNSSSTGSEETGVEIQQDSPSWWPAQALTAQLWSFWHEICQWNGAPKLSIPPQTLETFEQTRALLYKDTCVAKTTVSVLLALDVHRYKDAVQLCIGRSTPELRFLGVISSATLHKDIDKIPGTVRKLEEVLSKHPTFHNQTMLCLVRRFSCYLSYTYKIPTQIISNLQDDPVLVAWSALLNNTQDILTNENRHPMVEAVKLYMLSSTGRHVHVEKLLTLREQYPTNFTYNTLIIMVLKNLVDKDMFETIKFDEILNKCYIVDQKNSLILHYLGDQYRYRIKNASDAARYYEKSIRLDPNVEVLKKIDSLCQSEPDVRDANIKSHCHLVKISRDYKLFVRLSILCEDDDLRSTKYLQQAVKLSQDPLIFELLGEKYLHRGKYTSSYKAYSKANEREPTNFRMSSMASILLVLGKPNEALQQFQVILESSPTYSRALRGCAQCYYQLVLRAISTARYPHAVDLANSCINYIDQVLLFEPRWSNTWKYLGDICLVIVQLRDATLTLGSNIRKMVELETEQVSGQDIIHLAIQSYKQGLELHPRCSEYLVDLTRCYLLLSDYQDSYLLHALILAKRAVTLRPTDYRAWNILGCVCIRHKVYKLAQHAFIKSLNLDKDDNPEAWTNLGILYMLQQEYELANKCYTEAQSNNPKYSQSWVAQGYLAVLMGYKEESKKIFKDLARDTTRDTTIQGTLSFAVHFCQDDMYKEESRDLLHELLTLTTRCTHYTQSTWIMSNITAILLEQLALHKQALPHYLKALTLATSPDIRVKIENNVNRTHCAMTNYTAISSKIISFWSAAARMNGKQYGMASSILDNMAGQDVAVFQAVLSWLSHDPATTASFLRHTDSDIATLIKCFLLQQQPPQYLSDTIDTRPDEVQAKYTCLLLHLTKDDDEVPPNLALNSASLYLLAKYLVIRRKQLDIAIRLCKRLRSALAYKEDLLELQVQCLVLDRGDTKYSDNSIEETDQELRKCALQSVHMYPWRDNSKQMLDLVKQNYQCT